MDTSAIEAVLAAVVVEEVVLPVLSASGGEAALTAWVERHGGETPGAVLCINDLVAVGVQRGLSRSSRVRAAAGAGCGVRPARRARG